MIDVKRKLHVKVLFFFVVFTSSYQMCVSGCEHRSSLKTKEKEKKKKERTTGTFVDDLSSETYCKHIIIPPSFHSKSPCPKPAG